MINRFVFSILFQNKRIMNPNMAKPDEKLRLQWNGFRDNISSAFGDLRQGKDFTDVTLACEDGQQVEAHKVVLVASSPFFLDLLKRNKHPHTMIDMKGVKSEILIAMMDFFYLGEANFFQENLESFLKLAGKLQLKGLTQNQTEREGKASQEQDKKNPLIRSSLSNRILEQCIVKKEETELLEPKSERKVTMSNQASENTNKMKRNTWIMAQKVKSLMKSSDNSDPNSKSGSRTRICKICGQEGPVQDIKSHIEANHIAGISIPCDLCGKLFKSRNSLGSHKSQQHRNK